MPVVIDGAVARIEDTARVEEAEALVSFLESNSAHQIDLGACRHMHAAVLQVLLAYRPAYVALPPDPVLRDVLVPPKDGAQPSTCAA